MDSSILTFSPQRCADLHNQLIAEVIKHNPTLCTERTLATRFLEAAPKFADVPSLDSLPLYRFLGLLDTTSLVENKCAALLTPLMFQPDLSTFRTEHVGHEPHFVLLHGQNNGDSPMDGGLYLDIQSYPAV
ncbi:hypothetical protein F5B21DRAFT_525713 [Xylaria acuta]|nr:hypothetical protein F5B21DRAFT_525713 [Xylaria acuta]